MNVFIKHYNDAFLQHTRKQNTETLNVCL